MSSSTPRRRLRPLLFFALQAGLWVALTLAFATLVDLAGWIGWQEAYRYSAGTWLPWIVLAPLVFWLATRFPIERGRLWRSIPLHLVACAGCAVLMLALSAYIQATPREGRGPPPSPFGGGPRADGARPTQGSTSTPEGGERGGRAGWERRIAEVTGGRSAQPPQESVTPGAPMPSAAEGRGGPNPRGGFGRRGPPPNGEGPEGFRFNPFRLWSETLGVNVMLRANLGVAIYLIVAAFAHVVGYYRRTQQRERQALALAAGLNRAKLDALRLQLQPHFLFNTLNAISTLVHRDANAADELIGDLSELLRISLRTSEHEVPLSRELELLDRYLAIEQTRLNSRLQIVREIDPAATTAMVPTFMLQPLAENAIRHGIEPRREGGTLTIRATAESGTLRLVVADNGVGLKAVDRDTARRGIGLANSEERLRTLHGPAAQLELVSPESGGVEVRIVLPIRTTPAPVAATEAVVETPAHAT